MEEKKQPLNEKELEMVTGGSDGDTYDEKRQAFEKAWTVLAMDSKGFSGIERSELFRKWL